MIFEVMTFTGLILAVIALVMSIYSLIISIALKNSTHKVSFYDPSSQTFEDITDETKANLNKSAADSLDSLV